MKWLDLPPIWLAAALVLAWAAARLGLTFPAGIWAVWLGAGLVLTGALSMGLTVLAFARAKTTVIPHQTPDALVTDGILSLSRNPIYLGDALVLAGMSLIWASPLGLLLVPVFVLIIRARFILPEEARLAATFGPAYDAYAARVRRWI